MIERWCMYHKPEPIPLEIVDDGMLAVIRTDGICRACMKQFQRGELRFGTAGFARRAPSLRIRCASSEN